MSSSPVAGRGGPRATRARTEPARSAAPSHARAGAVAPPSHGAPPRRTPSAGANAPPLRLVNAPAAAPPGHVGEPIEHATDPRWVLAVRTAEQLEGALLAPEKRQRLVRTGRLMGLTPFDCNLVIAIVQDQARRGHVAASCPAAGERQLCMVPLPARASVFDRVRRRPALLVTVLVTTALLLELALLRWVF